MLTETVRERIAESTAVIDAMAEQQASLLVEITSRLTETLERGGTIYFCGNGGSAADAQHIAAEFVGRFLRERRPLPAVALTANTSVLTAVANDYGFEQVFARQIAACAKRDDAVVGISTSGSSVNVLEAVRTARAVGALTIGFTGASGEQLASQVDLCLRVPSDITPYIQQAHIVAWHTICGLVEDAVAPNR